MPRRRRGIVRAVAAPRLRRLRIDVLLEHDLIAEMRGISPPLDLGNRASAAPAAPTVLVSLECDDEQQPEREQDDRDRVF